MEENIIDINAYYDDLDDDDMSDPHFVLNREQPHLAWRRDTIDKNVYSGMEEDEQSFARLVAAGIIRNKQDVTMVREDNMWYYPLTRGTNIEIVCFKGKMYTIEGGRKMIGTTSCQRGFLNCRQVPGGDMVIVDAPVLDSDPVFSTVADMKKESMTFLSRWHLLRDYSFNLDFGKCRLAEYVPMIPGQIIDNKYGIMILYNIALSSHPHFTYLDGRIVVKWGKSFCGDIGYVTKDKFYACSKHNDDRPVVGECYVVDTLDNNRIVMGAKEINLVDRREYRRQVSLPKELNACGFFMGIHHVHYESCVNLSDIYIVDGEVKHIPSVMPITGSKFQTLARTSPLYALENGQYVLQFTQKEAFDLLLADCDNIYDVIRIIAAYDCCSLQDAMASIENDKYALFQGPSLVDYLISIAVKGGECDTLYSQDRVAECVRDNPQIFQMVDGKVCLVHGLAAICAHYTDVMFRSKMRNLRMFTDKEIATMYSCLHKSRVWRYPNDKVISRMLIPNITQRKNFNWMLRGSKTRHKNCEIVYFDMIAIRFFDANSFDKALKYTNICACKTNVISRTVREKYERELNETTYSKTRKGIMRGYNTIDMLAFYLFTRGQSPNRQFLKWYAEERNGNLRLLLE